MILLSGQGARADRRAGRYWRVRLSHVLCLLPVFVTAAAAQQFVIPAGGQSAMTPQTGVIQGTVLDGSGASLSGAAVKVAGMRTGAAYSAQTGAKGEYSISGVQPDDFRVTASAAGFDPVTIDHVSLAPGQNLEVATIMMQVATVSATVNVTASQRDVAEAQLKSEEKQRLGGILPNYYVAYFPNPAPLSAGQKMRLALRLAIDPVNIGIDAARAGFQANDNKFAAYGTGAEGFGKRFAAAYVNDASGTIIASGVLASLFHQDPRYHYKGTGSFGSRMLYALSWSVRCKGDDGNWQVNYTSILGNAAVVGLSELYYPKAVRDDSMAMVNSTLINVASQGVSAVLQEFVFKHLTTHSNEPGKAASSDVTSSSPDDRVAAAAETHSR